MPLKFSEAWLRTWVNPAANTKELAHLLTMGGVEVEALDPAAPPYSQVVVGEIVTVDKHPQADRLNCLTVNVGAAESLSIVCGAPNVRVGMKAPCAMVGAVLPGDMTIKLARVRGVESQGMMCSAKELGLSEESQGLLELAQQAPVGCSIRDWLALDDWVMTLKLTPNRADCLSIRGVAREVAALTGAELEPWVPPSVAVSWSPDRLTNVCLAAPECARYVGRTLVLAHPERPTPEWMVRHLERSGLRAKFLAVDVTNYVMLELGQPLHAFDATQLRGDLTVRWAQEGESLTLLDGAAVMLDSQLLVVADEQGPQALAGLMGGKDSAVTAQSREVFLEAAWFSPKALAGRARRLNLTSESAFRFERGVDPEGTREALERASQLLLELAGGEAGSITEVIGSCLPQARTVMVRASRVTRLLGFVIPLAEMEQVLVRIGARPTPCDGGWRVIAPSYRADLDHEVDFIEEIARCYGYDRIPEKLALAPLAGLPEPEVRRSRYQVFQQLNDLGFQEVVTYSFVSAERDQKLAQASSSLALLNPLAAHMGVMRATLATGLLETLSFNLKRKQENVKIFEWGRCFLAGEEAGLPYAQPLRLGGLWYGQRAPTHWGQAPEWADFYDIKGLVESLLRLDGVAFEKVCHPALHPGRSAQMVRQGKIIGWLGELHPTLRAQMDLPRAPLLFELEWEPLSQRLFPHYQANPRFQPVRRDIALVLDEAIPGGEVLAALREASCDGVEAVNLFDVYDGQGLPQGKKSLAFCVTIQDRERVSTDSELDQICRTLVAVAERRFGAMLR